MIPDGFVMIAHFALHIEVSEVLFVETKVTVFYVLNTKWSA